MGRPLRQLTPCTLWFVTTRCIEARFLLRPVPMIYATIGLFLARSCHRYPGIRLLGAVSMSNQ